MININLNLTGVLGRSLLAVIGVALCGSCAEPPVESPQDTPASAQQAESSPLRARKPRRFCGRRSRNGVYRKGVLNNRQESDRSPPRLVHLWSSGTNDWSVAIGPRGIMKRAFPSGDR